MIFGLVRIVDDGVFPAPRDKIWRLNDAHGKDIVNIHPSMKSVKLLRKEGNSDVLEVDREMGEQIVKQVVKITANPPDTLTVELMTGPMKGKFVNTYSDVPGGTKIVVVADVTSDAMNDQQLETTVRQFLDMVFNEDLQYLNKIK